MTTHERERGSRSFFAGLPVRVEVVRAGSDGPPSAGSAPTIVTAGPSAAHLADALAARVGGVPDKNARIVLAAVPTSTLEANRLADLLVRGSPGMYAGLVVRDGRDAVARAVLELIAAGDDPIDLPAPALAEVRAARAFHIRREGPPAPVVGVELLRWLLARWIPEVALVQALARELGHRCVMVVEDELVADPAGVADRVLAAACGSGALAGPPNALDPVLDAAGLWRTVFTNETRAAFKGSAGALLIELGFARDLHW
jgi:hypothetical protein